MKKNMTIKQLDKKIVGVVLILGICIVSGCKSGENGTNEIGCEDAFCYETCLEENEEDFSESYWTLRSAYCKDDNTCACNFGCEDNACAEFCVTEGYREGRCNLFDCICSSKAVRDAGDGDAGDAG
jgi:hypothetical protein